MKRIILFVLLVNLITRTNAQFECACDGRPEPTECFDSECACCLPPNVYCDGVFDGDRVLENAAGLYPYDVPTNMICLPDYPCPNCNPCNVDHSSGGSGTGSDPCICATGWSRPYCDEYTCGDFPTLPCGGRGTCVDQSGTGDQIYGCNCNFPWDGDSCDECVPGRFGTNCACNSTGADHQIIVDSQFVCVCKPNWGGPSCSQCDDGWTGHNCSTCTYTNPDCCDCASVSTESCDEESGVCTCETSWFGDLCEYATCDFGTNPEHKCLHGASCMVTEGELRCRCELQDPPLWTGSLCQCSLEGTASVSGMICDCDLNHNGTDCSYRRANCSLDNTIDYIEDSCICNPQWKGEECREPTGCDAAGTLSWNGTHCVCKSGYGGLDCSTVFCSAIPDEEDQCSGRGECIDDACICDDPISWTGTICQTPTGCNINNTYQYNGTCQCEQLWIDESCSTPCSPNNTLWSDNSQCYCKPGWVGETCEAEGCNPLTTTGEIVGSFGTVCYCKKGWSGSLCDENQCGECIDGDGDDDDPCSVCKEYHSNVTRGVIPTHYPRPELCVVDPIDGPTAGWFCPALFWCYPIKGPGCNTTYCSLNGTIGYDEVNQQCICKFGYMLPYCCEFGTNSLEPWRGPCLEFGTRQCYSDELYTVDINGESSCTVSYQEEKDDIEAFNDYYMPGVIQIGASVICIEGHDPSQGCCPYGRVVVEVVDPSTLGEFKMCGMNTAFNGAVVCRDNTLQHVSTSGSITTTGSIAKLIDGTCNILDHATGGSCDDFMRCGCPASGGSAPHCGGNGLCVEGLCQCNPGWGGPSCDTPECNNDGSIFTNTSLLLAMYSRQPVCECKEGWNGSSCACPPDFRAFGSTEEVELLECGGLGQCDYINSNGYCDCDSGYGGTYCCPSNCNDHGKCSMNWNTMIPYCECDRGYSGTLCSTQAACPSNCNGHGTCDDYYYSDPLKLDYQLDYQDTDLLLNNMSIAIYDTTEYSTGYSSYFFEPRNSPDIWKIRRIVGTSIFQSERVKALTYDTFNDWVYEVMHYFNFELGPTFNTTFMNSMRTLLTGVRSEDHIYAIGMIMSYPMLLSTSVPKLVGRAPSMDRPERSCACDLGYSGPSCINTCVASPLNSKPCTSMATGDFHGVCMDTGSCACASRWGSDSSCSRYRGDGCFQSLNVQIPCTNRGTCVTYGWGNSSCICQPGKSGAYCDEYLCSADSTNVTIRRTECNEMGSCPATGICICNVADELDESDSISDPPILPVGKDCRVNAIAECGNAVQVSGAIYQWRQCNNHGICLINSTTEEPYCDCDNGYSGPKCLTSLCNPECNSHQICNIQTGTCSCQPKWSGTGCQTSLCGAHGVPSDDGTSCVCDDHYRVDSSGACTILQCPLAILTDQGTQACNVTCRASSALESHQTGCCFDQCITGSGATLCSNSTGSLTCSCPLAAAWNQIDGVCFSKCNGQAYEPNVAAGFRCLCSSAFFIQDPWNATTDIMNIFCWRRRCLNGGVATQSNTVCACVNGYTGTTCEIPPIVISTSPTIPSSSSTSSSISASSSPSYSSTDASTTSFSTSSPSLTGSPSLESSTMSFSGVDSFTGLGDSSSTTTDYPSTYGSSTAGSPSSSTANGNAGGGSSSSSISTTQIALAVTLPVAGVGIGVGIVAWMTQCFKVPLVIPGLIGGKVKGKDKGRYKKHDEDGDSEDDEDNGNNNDNQASTITDDFDHSDDGDGDINLSTMR